MIMAKRTTPRCIIIAGPNGAGKTTFARSYLVQEERAAKEARRMAKMHGTKVWVMIDGKVVGLKP
jgi:ABC-type Mn2+/Zn2+ transport system ATPase subunit